jgi:hypothetical protein
MIISNPTNLNINLNCTIENLPYKITTVEDYFTQNEQGSWNDNSINIKLGEHEVKVIRLK